MASTNKDILVALKNSYKTKSKTEYDGFQVEYVDLSSTDPHDVSSAFLSTTSAVFTAGDANNNSDLGFAKFLGEDFVKSSFLLVSKESKLARAVAEKSQIQSVSPTHLINNKPSSPRKKQVKSETDSSAVWGSPLKWRIPSDDSSLDCDLLELSQLPATRKKRYSKRKGVPVNTARQFLSTFYMQIGDLPDFSNLVVLCEGTDLRSTALLASRIIHVTDQGHMSKIFKTTTVTADQKTSTDWNSKIKLPSGKSPSCQAVYQISMQAEEGEQPWGAVAVEMTWKGASQLLESPPSNAKTVIKASVTSGSMRSRMYKLYQELDLLQRIVTSLSTGEMLWESDVSDRPAVSLVTATRNLIRCLNDDGAIQLGGAPHENGEAEEVVTFSSAINREFSVPERSDFDFTDHHWKVLTDCLSTADLIDSLRVVFGALGRRELQPFVDQQNQTTVARIVRESLTGRYSAPSLTGLQPLLFMAEMGAEKLRRDYINVFVSQHLAGLSLLAPFISTEGELSNKLENLQKLHASLEMVVLLSTTLHLPFDTLGSAARQMLTHFTQNAVSPHQTHSFSLKTAEVQSKLTALPPVMWSMETHTVVAGDVRESSLYCLCASQPFLHISAHSGESVTEANESMNAGEMANDFGQEIEYCLVQRKETVVIL